jgi:hypothetical protein
MSDQLKRAIAVAKKTNSSVIVFQENSSYALMDLDQFEDLFSSKKNLTDDDLADKINREIALWKNQTNSDDLSSDQEYRKGRWQISPQIKDKAKEIE